jgi:hypothetical protein
MALRCLTLLLVRLLQLLLLLMLLELLLLLLLLQRAACTDNRIKGILSCDVKGGRLEASDT